MAQSIITSYFRLHNVKQFVESISETANSVYYVFVGKHQTYGSGDNAEPPALYDSVQDVYLNAYRDMVFGKRVTPSDVKSMIKRRAWASGTVYTPYRSDLPLSDEPYFVYVQEVVGGDYHVYKCLDNNGGSASTQAPVYSADLAGEEFLQTLGDSYVWKYMFSIPVSDFNKFATADYIPVIPNANVIANAVPGSIDLITVTSGGSHYDTYLSNTFVSADLRLAGNNVVYAIADNAHPDNDFYTGSYIYITAGGGQGQGRRIVDYVVVGDTKYIEIDYPFNGDDPPTAGSIYEITPGVLIIGDGSGAEARAIVGGTSNSIVSVEVLQRGRNYTYATAIPTGNTSGYSNAALLTPIMGPKGGHGSDPEYELGATSLCVSISLTNNEGNTIPTHNDFRQVGLLKDPLFNNVELTLSTPTGNFQTGETVTQDVTDATGTVVTYDGSTLLYLTNVNGVFTSGESVRSVTNANANVSLVKISGSAKGFSTFDQRYRYAYTDLYNSFAEDEPVYQTDAQLASAVVHSVDPATSTTGVLNLTHLIGTINTGNTISGTVGEGTATLLSVTQPDLVEGSGEVLYLENRTPVSRANSQTETVKIILEF